MEDAAIADYCPDGTQAVLKRRNFCLLDITPKLVSNGTFSITSFDMRLNIANYALPHYDGVLVATFTPGPQVSDVRVDGTAFDRGRALIVGEGSVF